jgi:hypothetical protein
MNELLVGKALASHGGLSLLLTRIKDIRRSQR